MSSVLAPVAAAAYKNGHQDWYGAVELDYETGEEVWRFDATQTEFDTAQLYQDGSVVKHRGFRPASVQRLSNGMTLISGWRRGVIVDEDGDVHQSFTHDLMNDVHEIQKASDGTYLVASTGMDTLLKLDEDFDVIWKWHMWESLDDNSRPEGYYPSSMKFKDARDFALDPYDRYHLNYATPVGQDEILCSALNYGIFTIDADTRNVQMKMTDLDECHNPYSMGGTYVVCESGADRVVEVDWNNHHEVMFDNSLSFVKDADPINREGDWLITDTKNNRVLVWNIDDDEPKQEFFLGEDSKPYEADYLEGSDSNA